MKLINKIEIVGVRSIRDEVICKIGSLSTFVGKNSSGKSNVLRALNLFFNGELDPGAGLDFSRDHYERHPRIRKKKRIAVVAHFELPAEFKIRSGLDELKRLGRLFQVSREWTLDQSLKPIERFNVIVDGIVQGNSEILAAQFLGLINYRYIPNYINPVELLKDESNSLAELILGRLGSDTQSVALLSSLSTSAERVLGEASQALKSTGSPISTPTIFDGSNLAEFLTTKGFQAQGAHGLAVSDDEWGSGHQSFFMYQILKLLDTNYSRYFGWRQATIWGIEEPETSLHHDLETRLAGILREWCDDPSCRFQVFVTSHSSIFLTAAESGYLVSLPEQETQIQNEPICQLVRKAESYGVTPWTHPALSFPFNPVVLVEGQIDEDVLTKVANLIGLSYLRFVTVPDLQGGGGGKDSMIRFFGDAKKYIVNRDKGCPFMALFDWDVSDQEMAKARARYGDGSDKFVLRMDVGLAHARMRDDFIGIERFYGPGIIEDAIADGELVAAIRPDGSFAVNPYDLNAAKKHLRRRVLEISDPDDQNLRHLKNMVVTLGQRLIRSQQLELILE